MKAHTMKNRKQILFRILPALLAMFVAHNTLSAAAPAIERDIVIYGGSSAGIAAAVQAKRMGKSVVIVEAGDRIGGLTTGGLGQTDIGNTQAIGGISLEFYRINGFVIKELIEKFLSRFCININAGIRIFVNVGDFTVYKDWHSSDKSIKFAQVQYVII